jgi:hypothetical protein
MKCRYSRHCAFKFPLLLSCVNYAYFPLQQPLVGTQPVNKRSPREKLALVASLREHCGRTSHFVRFSRSAPQAGETRDSSDDLRDFDADGVEVMQDRIVLLAWFDGGNGNSQVFYLGFLAKVRGACGVDYDDFLLSHYCAGSRMNSVASAGPSRLSGREFRQLPQRHRRNSEGPRQPRTRTPAQSNRRSWRRRRRRETWAFRRMW